MESRRAANARAASTNSGSLSRVSACCGELVGSGVVARLRTLDLSGNGITDAGARVLADCPDLPRLEGLNLSGNALTEDGVAVLRATGVNLRVDSE